MLADLVVALHAGFVVFVLFGGLGLHRWRWLAWLHAPAMLYGPDPDHRLGLTGTEPMLAALLIAVLLAINLRPYLRWATG